MSKEKKEEKKFDSKKEIDTIVEESQEYLKEYNGLIEGINQAEARKAELLSLIQLNNGKIQGIKLADGEPRLKVVENKK